MKIEEAGKMIHALRKRWRVSQYELCQGICSISTLSRLETGKRRPNILIFNAFLQRLGKSADYINVVLTLEEFEYIVKKWEVENFIFTENFVQAEKKLALLEKELKTEGLSLQRQEAYYLYALLYLYKENNYAEALKYVYRALTETIPDFTEEKIYTQYFSVSMRYSQSELQLLLLYTYIKEQLGDEEAKLMEWIISYITLLITDRKARNRNLSQALCLQAYRHKKESMWRKCYEYCEDVIEAEVKNGQLFMLFQALEMEMECLENGVVEANGKLRRKQYEHLKDVLETCGKEESQRKRFTFLLDSTSQENSLIDEVIRFSRLRGGYSQGELSKGVCCPENFSRMETGRHNPAAKTFHAIMNKSGLQMGYFNTELAVERFETLEKIDELKHLIILKNFAEADKLLERLEEEIDMNLVKNQQQIGLYHTVFDYRLGKIRIEEALEKVEQLLEMTLKKEGREFGPQYQPTFEEVSILNQIAVYYHIMGNLKCAIEILMFLYEYFNQSKLEAVKRSQKYFMVLGNLASYLEEQGELEQAMRFAEESLEIGIKYNIGLRVGSNLITKAYIQERLGNEDCLKNYGHGYYLCGLFGDSTNQNIVKQHVFESSQITYED